MVVGFLMERGGDVMRNTYIVTFEVSSDLDLEDLKNYIIRGYKKQIIYENLILLTKESWYNNESEKIPPYQSTLRHHANKIMKGDMQNGIKIYKIKASPQEHNYI